MKATLTKTFEFSASHAQGSKIVGHNYTLRATFLSADAQAESGLSDIIENSLIKRIRSRDLGQNVDFLNGMTLSDPELLKAFWRVLEPAVRPAALSSLSLERDRHTVWSISLSG